jgi:hypothetical protein
MPPVTPSAQKKCFRNKNKLSTKNILYKSPLLSSRCGLFIRKRVNSSISTVSFCRKSRKLADFQASNGSQSRTSEPFNPESRSPYFLLRTSSTQPMAAIILGKPVVVNDSKTAWAIYSAVAPDSRALRVLDMTAPREFAPMAIPSLIRFWYF